MTPEEFADLLALGHETQGIEFKGPFARADKEQFAEVVRSVLGMANRQDGGLVVIGVDEHDDGSGAGKKLRAVGMSEGDRVGWDQDAVVSVVDSYADPFVELDVERVQYEGKHFVVLRVRGFAQFPVLCKKQFVKPKGPKSDVVLRQGACYVRRRGRIETSEIPTHVEMRELLDLATEKGIRRFLSRAHRAGLDIAGMRQIPDDAALFDAERGDFR